MVDPEKEPHFVKVHPLILQQRHPKHPDVLGSSAASRKGCSSNSECLSPTTIIITAIDRWQWQWQSSTMIMETIATKEDKTPLQTIKTQRSKFTPKCHMVVEPSCSCGPSPTTGSGDNDDQRQSTSSKLVSTSFPSTSWRASEQYLQKCHQQIDPYDLPDHLWTTPTSDFQLDQLHGCTGSTTSNSSASSSTRHLALSPVDFLLRPYQHHNQVLETCFSVVMAQHETCFADSVLQDSCILDWIAAGQLRILRENHLNQPHTLQRSWSTALLP